MGVGLGELVVGRAGQDAGGLRKGNGDVGRQRVWRRPGIQQIRRQDEGADLVRGRGGEDGGPVGGPRCRSLAWHAPCDRRLSGAWVP